MKDIKKKKKRRKNQELILKMCLCCGLQNNQLSMTNQSKMFSLRLEKYNNT